MAEYWADSRGPNGDGSEATPYNAIPSNAFGSGHTWNLAYGSVFDLGASQLTSGNSATVRAYGDEGAGKPMFTGTNSTLFACTIATGAVRFEDIQFVRSGAQGGIGINANQMSGAGASFTMLRCVVSGFNSLIYATRSRKVTIENCTLSGSSTTYGIRGQAQLTNNAEGWRIVGNTFDCGTDIELYVTDDAGSNGAFNDLVIEGNTMIGSSGAGTSMFLRGKCNATNYEATASIAINTPGPGTHTLTRNTGGAWPAWPNGTVIFLAGWSNVANFGTVTVTGGGGTTAVTVTDLGATLADEAADRGKGAGIRDAARAFNRPVIRNNVFQNRGLTPMFIDNFIDGVLENNQILDTVATGAVSAAIEAFNCVGTVARYNRIRNMTGAVTVDSMGIFWDGACENCTAHGNYIAGIRPTTTAENSGAALAAFFSTGSSFHSNIVEDCRQGLWVGGVATAVVACNNNTISGCEWGAIVNSSPAAGSVTLKNNVIQKCGTGIKDSASSVVSTNAWWQNTLDTHTGTLASKDGEAITADPKLSASLRPMPGSPLIGAGLHLGYLRDFDGVQRRNPPTLGAFDMATLRATA